MRRFVRIGHNRLGRSACAPLRQKPFQPTPNWRNSWAMAAPVSRPQKIILAEMRASGVLGLLINCSDYRCSHWVAISGDKRPDEVRPANEFIVRQAKTVEALIDAHCVRWARLSSHWLGIRLRLKFTGHRDGVPIGPHRPSWRLFVDDGDPSAGLPRIRVVYHALGDTISIERRCSWRRKAGGRSNIRLHAPIHRLWTAIKTNTGESAS